ncbi:MAG: zf-HC2 domain-containing protein [Gammaproteobacteria bacterium]
MSQEVNREHRQVAELLPWFVNKTLDEPELTRVKRHLNSCLLCRKDLLRQRQLLVAIREPVDIDQASREGFAALMGRIDAGEGAARHTWFAAAGRGVSRPWQLICASPPFLRVALAVQTLIIALGAVMWPSSLDQHAPLYRTLTVADSPVQSRLDRFRVVFTNRIDEKQLRDLVGEINGTIVAGPSAAGVFTIEIMPSAENHDHARVLQRLREDDSVQFAEHAHAQVTP